MREFGIVSASAFVLALVADFTALPGALWILSRYDHNKGVDDQDPGGDHGYRLGKGRRGAGSN
jgi:hypothetical protein